MTDLFILVSTLVLTIIVAKAQNFTTGSNLTTAVQSSRWLSSSGTFAFGFVRDGIKYKLGIWHVRDNTQFLVWTAGPNIQVDPGAMLELTVQGNLALYESSKRGDLLWSTATSGQGVERGELRDSGNLVLVNSTLDEIWQSFLNPTDTLLPDQVLQFGYNLTAFPTDTSLSKYYLKMESSGNLSLYWENRLSYWASATANSNQSTQIPTVAKFDSNGVLNLLVMTTSQDHVKQFFAADYVRGPTRRLTLDGDGNLRIYSLVSGGQNWAVQWQAVENQCMVYGYCGAYGICSYDTTGPICRCPLGFSQVDSRNNAKGCKGAGNITQCGGVSHLVALRNTAWLSYKSDESGRFNVQNNEEGCKSTCLDDQACFACLAPNDGSGNCIQFRSNFISGYTFPFVQSSAFVKLCNNVSPVVSSPTPPNAACESKKTGLKIAITSAGTFAGLLLIETLIWLFFFRGKKTGSSSLMSPSQYDVIQYASGSPVRHSYKELLKATNNFSTQIGCGGFGAVYKGVLENKVAIAVKKLEGIFQGEKEFRTEVATIGSTHHMNLMHLVGFCSEGSHRMLVYEYLPNGSLDKLLFPDSISETGSALAQSAMLLQWNERVSIALGTAKGIAYLHEECRDCIIHCDLKPENILLDDNLCAKVSDFGLAKMINEEETRTLTTVRGTRGYLAPEWLANMPITAKSDVFSYGMILLEIIGGRRNFEASYEDEEKQRFPNWAFRKLEEGKVREILDERLPRELEESEVNEVERVARVAFWCIQENSSHRPSMSKVVQMLEGNLLVAPPPVPNRQTLF